MRTLDCDVEKGWEPVRAGGGDVKGDWPVSDTQPKSGNEGGSTGSGGVRRQERLHSFSIAKKERAPLLQGVKAGTSGVLRALEGLKMKDIWCKGGGWFQTVKTGSQCLQLRVLCKSSSLPVVAV